MPPIKRCVQLQDRDLFLLRDLLESRVMTLAHIAVHHFGGRAEAAKKRIQRLKTEGLLAERRRRQYEPSVLGLTAAAFALLKEHGDLDGYPSMSEAAWLRRSQVSDATIRHELAVMDVRAAFAREIAKTMELSCTSIVTWPRLIEFPVIRPAGESMLVRPDALVRIREKGSDGDAEHTFFLEVDRSSESLDTLAAKATDYREHYRSGDFARRNGGTVESRSEHPFRVLFALKSAERRNNIAERLLLIDPPILQMVMLGVFDDVVKDPLGAVWTCPADYRAAVIGSRHDVASRAGRPAFRDRDRERHVETRLKMRPLLE
jgi:hypothetical protein